MKIRITEEQLEMIKGGLSESYIIVLKREKKSGEPRTGEMVYGYYKDGSTVYIPKGRYVEFDSKPKIYKTEEEAQKDLELFRKYGNKNITVSLEKL